MGRQRRAGAYYPDIGGWIANTAFSLGARRKQEYRAVIGKKRPDLPSADVDAFMSEVEKLGNTKAEKAALHWFIKGGLQLPQEEEILKTALEVSKSFKIDPFQMGSPQEVLNAARQMASDRTREVRGPFLGPEDVGLELDQDNFNGLKVYSVDEDQQEAVWRLMRSQGYVWVDPKTNKVEAYSPWCLLVPTDSGDRPSQSAINYWSGNQEILDELERKREEHESWVEEARAKWEEEHKDEEDPEPFPEEDYEYEDDDYDEEVIYARGYTGAPKLAAFFRDRIVAFSGVLDSDNPNESGGSENWWDLKNLSHGGRLKFFWDGDADDMGLAHLPPDTPVHVEGSRDETIMTAGDKQNGIYEVYSDNELTERALYKDGERVRDLPLDDVSDIDTLLDAPTNTDIRSSIGMNLPPLDTPAPGNTAFSLTYRELQAMPAVSADGVVPITNKGDLKRAFRGFGVIANNDDGREALFPAKTAGKFLSNTGERSSSCRCLASSTGHLGICSPRMSTSLRTTKRTQITLGITTISTRWYAMDTIIMCD